MPPGFEVRGTTGRELMRQLVGHNLGLVLNPANRHGKEFLVAEMSDLLAGVDPGTTHRVQQQGSSVQVGEPAHVPDGLVERLTPGLRRARRGRRRRRWRGSATRTASRATCSASHGARSRGGAARRRDGGRPARGAHARRHHRRAGRASADRAGAAVPGRVLERVQSSRSRRSRSRSYAGRQASATAASWASSSTVARSPGLEAGRAQHGVVPVRRPDPVGVARPGGPVQHPLGERDAEPAAEPPQVHLGVAQEVAGVDRPGRRRAAPPAAAPAAAARCPRARSVSRERT